MQSMSRKGNCLENLFGLMKNELLYVNHFYFESEQKKYIFGIIQKNKA